MKSASMAVAMVSPQGGRRYARTVHVSTPAPVGPDADNVWKIGSEEEEDEDLDLATAFDITGGEWEPTAVKVRRKLQSLLGRLF